MSEDDRFQEGNTAGRCASQRGAVLVGAFSQGGQTATPKGRRWSRETARAPGTSGVRAKKHMCTSPKFGMLVEQHPCRRYVLHKCILEIDEARMCCLVTRSSATEDAELKRPVGRRAHFFGGKVFLPTSVTANLVTSVSHDRKASIFVGQP